MEGTQIRFWLIFLPTHAIVFIMGPLPSRCNKNPEHEDNVTSEFLDIKLICDNSGIGLYVVTEPILSPQVGWHL
jgi:hypothetical protein